MTDHIEADPVGLATGSAAVNAQADSLTAVDDTAMSASHPSLAGAASVSASLRALLGATAGRLTDNADKLQATAANYHTTDEDGAAHLGQVAI